MRGVYRANVSVTGRTATQTALYITAPSGKIVRLLSATITPKGSNVTLQMLEACWQRVSSLGTPTGTSLTPSKSENGDQASGSTVVGNVTASEPTYASNSQIGLQGFGNLSGYFFQPAPEERPVIAGGDTWGLRVLTSTFTSQDYDVEAVYQEEG